MNLKIGLWSTQFSTHSSNDGTELIVKLLADVSICAPTMYRLVSVTLDYRYSYLGDQLSIWHI